MHHVTAAFGAELLELKLARGVLFVLGRSVVLVLAFGAAKLDFDSHSITP
jgi:hypothetical protein